MIHKYFVIFFAFQALAAIDAADWCNLPSCKGRQHIACNNTGTFPSPLPSSCESPSQVNLTPAQIQQFVDGHNFYRNQIALGSVNAFTSAKRMAKMTWDPLLAEFAGLNTLQCRMNHDACHNTEKYNFAGQNLASSGTTGTHTTEVMIDKALLMWYKENLLANMTDIDLVSRSGSSSGKSIGHFTAMVTDRSTAVGCAMATYKSGKWNNYLVTCNYASTNMIGTPVYKSGPVASACSLGADEKFPGLCREDEPIDSNKL